MGKKQKPKPQRKRRQQQRDKEKESQHREESLPADVVYEILVRNPIKTLAKFRCVCKQWGSIISQPSFQEDHHRRSSQASPFVLLTKCEFNKANETKTSTLHISTYTSEGTLVNNFSKGDLDLCNYISIQSCRGLVCLGPRYRTNSILICNPSTEELITLPPTEGNHICIGFGYATATNEFKVVRFFRHPEFDDSQMCCEVFTLGTSGWREARNPPPQYPPNFLRWGAPFLHGALHILPFLTSDCDCTLLLVDVFDIEKEAYTKIPLPEYFRTMKKTSLETMYTLLETMYLRELEGSLCLIFDFVMVLEIWCLRDYHNREWVKKYSVSLHSRGDDFFWVEPLNIMADGTMMLYIVMPNIEVEDEEEARPIELEDEEQALYYYNFGDKSLTKSTKMHCWGTLYVESFLAPNGICMFNMHK